MKITFLNTSDTIGGAAVACRRICEALSENGAETALLVQEKLTNHEWVKDLGGSALGKKLALLRLAREKAFFLFLEKSKSVRFSFSLANTGIDVTKKYDFLDSDIIHLHWINQGFLSLKSLGQLFRLNKPVVWTLHDMWPFTGGCHHPRGCERYMDECRLCPYLAKPGEHDISNRIWHNKKKLYENARITITTPSKWLAERARESALFGKFPIYAVPNPLNTEIYRPSDKTEARVRLGLDPGKTYIGFAALNTANYFKGSTYLRDALAKLAAGRPDARDKIAVLLLGKKDETAGEQIPFPVFSPGYITDEARLIEYYNALDVFVLPSLEENLPNTLVEAMACGVPCVSFRTGGVPEIIDHQINGYVAELKSVEDLTRGMEFILDKISVGKEFSENARNKAVQWFGYPSVAGKFEAVYQTVLNK